MSELRGFKRVSISSNETKTVSMELPVNSLAYYDVTDKDFRIIPGRYEILVGAASDDIRLKSVITLK
jgi:beta-glucosidase